MGRGFEPHPPHQVWPGETRFQPPWTTTPDSLCQGECQGNVGEPSSREAGECTVNLVMHGRVDRDVTVGVHRDLDAGVPQDPADNRHRHSGLQQGGGGDVPQVVEPAGRETRVARGSPNVATG